MRCGRYPALSVILTAVLVLGLHRTGVAATTCDSDSPKFQLDLNKCLYLGRAFVDQYMHSLRTDEQFKGLCLSFKEFEVCLNDLKKSCDNTNEELSAHWWTLYAHFACACSNHSDCLDQKLCLEQEVRHSTFFHLCGEEQHRNTLQYHGRSDVFLEDRLKCETTLIWSACGDEGSRVFEALLDVEWPERDKFLLPKDREYYQYSSSCPRNLDAKVQECTSLHPSSDVVNFYLANDLIPQIKRNKLISSCQSFRSYMDCLHGYSQVCPDGIASLLNNDGYARMYNIKMDHICSDKNFIQHLRCYRRLATQPMSFNCSAVTESANALLLNITAYDYYCQPESAISELLKSSLANIRQCFQREVISECGRRAAPSLESLIDKAFADPYFLRFTHKPDCQLFKLAMQTTRLPVASTTVSYPATAWAVTVKSHDAAAQDSSAPSCAPRVLTAGWLAFLLILLNSK